MPINAVALLGLLSPGAATDGCHPVFWLTPLQSDDLLLAVVSSPLPSSHVVYPVFFLNAATKK